MHEFYYYYQVFSLQAALTIIVHFCTDWCVILFYSLERWMRWTYHLQYSSSIVVLLLCFVGTTVRLWLAQRWPTPLSTVIFVPISWLYPGQYFNTGYVPTLQSCSGLGGSLLHVRPALPPATNATAWSVVPHTLTPLKSPGSSNPLRLV